MNNAPQLGEFARHVKTSPPKPFLWILDLTCLNLVELSKLSPFSEIMIQVTRNKKGWKNWSDHDSPEEEIIPDGYSHSLDSFHILLLIRSWCPHHILSQARKYIRDSLNEKYTEPVVLNLASAWEESDPHTPLICLLSMGSDPTDQIDALAKKLRLECRTIAMGPGQILYARRLLQLFMQQASIRFNNESPQGMRAGMKRTLTGISQDFLDASSNPVWKPLLYTVAFLHSAVQERRKYGSLGWNVPYEFTSAVFMASVQFMQNHPEESGGRKVWFSEKMSDPSLCFYTGYNIAHCRTVEQFLSHIQSLPAVDSPQVFGLHPNADIT
ncbi:dynein axonemal heavy chain 8-like [Leptodactylus fuscus]|uniref:dynein axonemal heavy chain 8-like n=1 Tax=Leptodactylus fuscus TaxID=238119 RepID=UPI003F4E6443